MSSVEHTNTHKHIHKYICINTCLPVCLSHLERVLKRRQDANSNSNCNCNWLHCSRCHCSNFPAQKKTLCAAQKNAEKLFIFCLIVLDFNLAMRRARTETGDIWSSLPAISVTTLLVLFDVCRQRESESRRESVCEVRSILVCVCTLSAVRCLIVWPAMRRRLYAAKLIENVCQRV